MNIKRIATLSAIVTANIFFPPFSYGQQFCLAPITATTECVEEALPCYGVTSWNHQKYASGLAKLCNQVAGVDKDRRFLAEKVDFLENQIGQLEGDLAAGNEKYTALEKRFRRLSSKLRRSAR